MPPDENDNHFFFGEIGTGGVVSSTGFDGEPPAGVAGPDGFLMTFGLIETR